MNRIPRWYGDTKPRDVIIPTLDDYVPVIARRYPKVYRMLDHVEVFVVARFRGSVLYGFGKFILSPDGYGQVSDPFVEGGDSYTVLF